jgi:hypothetical protein
MEKKTFVMYKEWLPMIATMTNEQAGQLLKAIYNYQFAEEETITDPLLNSIFQMLKKRFEIDAQAYAETCEKRRENGKKGGIAKASKSNQKLANASKCYQVLEEKNKKQEKEPKETYGTGGNVKLTIAEYEKLVTDYGADKTNKAIELLDGYIADKGYKSKDNNRALRRWVFDAVEEQEQKRAKINGGGNIRPVDVFFADQMQEVKERGIF